MSKKFDLDEYFDRMLKKEDGNSTQEKSKILYYIDEENGCMSWANFPSLQ